MSITVIKRLQSRGFQAYWVGGCVRDDLLRRPVKDRDVATDASPDQVKRLFPGARRAGERFGVMLVRAGKEVTEVATFRREGGYADGRRPNRVSFTADPRQDALRRDFTINAMLHDPVSGERLDFAGGAEDLRRGLIRAVGAAEARFGEDHLRMLRAVRFAAALGFEIEPATMAGIRAMAGKVGLVAAERVRDELDRILTEGGARRGFELLMESGLLEHLLPEVAAMRGVEQPPRFHPEGDVWTHTMLMLEGLREPSKALAWGVLLHDVGKPLTYSKTDRIRFNGHVEVGAQIAAGLSRKLRFSNVRTDQVVSLVSNHMRFKDIRQMRPVKLRRFLTLPRFEDHLELHRLDCLTSHGRLGHHDFALAELRKLEAQEPFVPLLTGRDLIAAGYTPGPQFAKILGAVHELQVEGELQDREEALKFVLGRFSRADRVRASN